MEQYALLMVVLNLDSTDSPDHWQQLLRALPPDGINQHFKTEAQRVRRLKAVRWPNGVRCYACGSSDIGIIKTRKYYQCRECRLQFSVTSGTICHRTHLDLKVWFNAAELIIEASKSERSHELLTSKVLSAKLGVTYKVAYELRKRLRADLALPVGGLIGRCICININHV